MKLLNSIDLKDIIFIDIETVSAEKDLTDRYKDAWEYKMRYSSEKFEGTLEDTFKEKSALFAEFGKIVCITIGKVGEDRVLQLHSFCEDDELKLLKDFTNVMNKLISSNGNYRLCGFGIKGFDLPYINRRCIINRVEIPQMLDTNHLKPWDLKDIDIQELYKGTGWYGTSLIALSNAIGLPSPKSIINGSEVSNTYYNVDGGLDIIKTYCEADVITTTNIYLHMSNQPYVESFKYGSQDKEVKLLEKIFNSKSMNLEEEAKLDSLVESLDEDDKEIAKVIVNQVKKRASARVTKKR